MDRDMTLPDGSHPAMRWLLIGLLATPLAWLLQMLSMETLAAQACYPFNQPLSAPVVPWLRAALVTISATCLLAGTAGSLIAWRNLRKTGPKEWGALSGARRSRAELERFLSRIAMMCSTLFLFALIATDVALALVSPCGWW
ncbi:hypothetical protein DR64_4340 [Paraburkholderia xenovorans LB400]|jgi:hypothetical protein|uniref:Transmembrane protein n=2 Tax=Paraburkholderia xenovorans TaxID=36873 RepID=Q13YQ6_PARXL|nr:hypothetical protein Bxe_A2186 [Paraburkholderia xenovorans LB400]AIP30817.1 hypothetical protein DR64_4340 [Paraburkholderia xenovorans LB400]